MESQHKMPKRPHMAEGVKTWSPEYETHDRCSCLRATAHQTEDISIRENEDGIRSHFCPLDEAQHSDLEDIEDNPDKPLRLDFQNMNSWSLKSDEVLCLNAVAPPMSGSEENENSDVDASTSMIYGQPCNRSSKDEETVRNCLGYYRHMTCQGRKLDEKTMASWVEDSSDEEDDYIMKRICSEALLQDNQLGDSDMEEFEETPESENIGYQERDLSQDERECLSGKHGEAQSTNKPSDDKTDTRHQTENLRMNNENDNFQSKNIMETDTDEASASQSSEKNKNLRSDEKEAHDHSETENDLKLVNDDGKVLTDRKWEQYYMKDQNFCQSGRDPLKKTLCAERENISVLSIQHSDVANEDKSISYEKDSEKSKIDVSSAYPNNYEHRVQEPPFQEEENSKETDEKMNSLTMETPVADLDKTNEDAHIKSQEIPPDLATELRFMTEIYHTKDDEDMFSGTLSESELSIEVSMKENVASEMIQRQERSTAIETILKSNTFESVLTEERKAVARPRNKLTKFFKSFKQRLTKKP